MTRSTYVFSLASLASIYAFGGLACSSSNAPATSSSAGTPAVSAGAPGAGGASAGAPAVTAGAPGVTAGSGGTDATAGAPSAGAPGTAGAPTGGAGASGGGMYTPLCAGLTTAGGMAPGKAVVCTAADPQLCYKTCGPQSVGYKSETCIGTAYMEQSGCSFPNDATSDYSCFKIPAAPPAACPTTTITASTACTVAACTPCADATGHYYDSTMMLKTGYCVCPAPAMPGGTSKWSCASDTAWPCPTGKGC
jgi:hypothetical protein